MMPPNDILTRYRFADPLLNVVKSSGSGFSDADIWRIERGQSTWYLRRWGAKHPSRERLTWIHQVLFAAANHDCPFIPVPKRTINGESFIDFESRFWEVGPWMPGASNFNQQPTEEKLSDAIKCLAKFHAATASVEMQCGVSPAVLDRHRKLHQLRPLLEELRQVVQGVSEKSLQLSAFRSLEMTEELLPKLLAEGTGFTKSTQVLQPVIRDAWHDHFLFVNDRLSGLIDFGAMRLDTVWCDWARFISSLRWNGQIPWTAAMALLRKHRPDLDENTAIIKWLSLTGSLFGLLNWIEWLFAENRVFADKSLAMNRLVTLMDQLKLETQPQSLIVE